MQYYITLYICSCICLTGRHWILDSWNIILVHYTCSSTIIAYSWILQYIVWSVISTGAVLTSLPFRWQKKSSHLWVSWEKKENNGEKKVKESKMKWDDSRCSGKGHAVMHHTVKMGELERVLWRDHKQKKRERETRGRMREGDGCRMRRQMKAAPVNTLKCNMVQLPKGGVASSRCPAKDCCLNFTQGGQSFSDVVPT